MGLTEWLSDSKYLLAGTCSYLLLPFWQDFDGLRAACASWSDFEVCGHEADLVGFDDLDEAGLEEACHIIERLMFLAQFIQDWESVHTCHLRFWRRVQRAKRSGPGYRQLTVSEITHAYDQYQDYWEHMGKKIHSGTVDTAEGEPATFDECVKGCLPEHDFNLIRMAMNLDACPGGGKGGEGGRGPKRDRERFGTPPKREPSSRGSWVVNSAWRRRHATAAAAAPLL